MKACTDVVRYYEHGGFVSSGFERVLLSLIVVSSTPKRCCCRLYADVENVLRSERGARVGSARENVRRLSKGRGVEACTDDVRY